MKSKQVLKARSRIATGADAGGITSPTRQKRWLWRTSSTQASPMTKHHDQASRRTHHDGGITTEQRRWQARQSQLLLLLQCRLLTVRTSSGLLQLSHPGWKPMEAKPMEMEVDSPQLSLPH